MSEKPTAAPTPELQSMLSVMPGHIVWSSADAKESGQFCVHRFVIHDNPDNPIPEAKCILCGGERRLSEGELEVIEEAAQAGVVFLKWQDRFEELSNLKGSRRQRRRRARSSSRGPTATGGVKQATEIPAGFIPVKEAAAKLNTEPKKLRRQIRAGHYEGVKVGGKVYVKVE